MLKITELMPQLQNLYGRQSRAIDTGNGVGWADTYTADGSYSSPSYEKAFVGTEELIEFGNSFPVRSPGAKHLALNFHVVEQTEEGAEVILNFVVVQGEPGKECTILRTVTAFDSIRIIDGEPRLSSRRIEF
ncbi:hypothetical protein N24_0098 [Corynebacterium suranareeae]|uniref:SnoaL-like domain-containing protein n=1 Tax=Corynebacterium suranareeae TaxID=2506452 RepID=A0A160PQ73_9CORY|nr:nuclear transport factor 2 family protein [Corynebacterium suranareeae]BAU94360.1 hypothetical protein N24_0098 [Corynebacterium suranareeae]